MDRSWHPGLRTRMVAFVPRLSPTQLPWRRTCVRRALALEAKVVFLWGTNCKAERRQVVPHPRRYHCSHICLSGGGQWSLQECGGGVQLTRPLQGTRVPTRLAVTPQLAPVVGARAISPQKQYSLGRKHPCLGLPSTVL